MLALYLNNHFGKTRITEDGSSITLSITTRQDRLASVFFVFEAIAQGTIRPSRAILWIDDPSAFAALPQSLIRLQKRGLEIIFTDNFGPHTKYFPYVMSLGHHEMPLVTGDDDQLYPRRWLEGLAAAYSQSPEYVHCHLAKVVRLDESGGVRPYEEWPKCRSEHASFDHIALGVSGVIYPPELLNSLRNAGDVFRIYCPNADDVWLHVQAIRAGYRIRQLASTPGEFLPVAGSQRVALWRQNVVGGGNNWQIRATYTPSDLAKIRWGAEEKEHGRRTSM
jgi:hypothetical protein